MSPWLSQREGSRIPAGGAILSGADEMPEVISYEAAKRHLYVGSDHVDNVPPEVWNYEVSGKQVLTNGIGIAAAQSSGRLFAAAQHLDEHADAAVAVTRHQVGGV